MNLCKNIINTYCNGKPEKISSVVEIPVSLISPNPDQPRKVFSKESITSLAKSISHDGIIQPLTVRAFNDGYVLVSGERRLRAAKIAGCEAVPCIIVKISDQRSAVIALVENIQRDDLCFFDQAEAVSSLISVYKMTQEDIALRLGLSQSTIANKLRLLRLTTEERLIIISNDLTERHARALLKLDDTSLRKTVLNKIVSSKLNVAETEHYIASFIDKEKQKRSYKRRSAVLSNVKLFFNTVDKAVKVMKLAGVNAEINKSETDGFIDYHIRIPAPEVKSASLVISDKL